MAEIVCALATSHTPQLSAPPETWTEYARRDRANDQLLGRDGSFHDYAELLAIGPRVADDELTLECWRSKHDRAQAAIGELRTTLTGAAPDVVVVVGDDQEELFLDDGVPTFAVFWGDGVVERPPTAEQRQRIPADVQAGLWAFHGEQPEVYPTSPNLGRHVIEQLALDAFDVTQIRRQHDDRTLGHAFTFVRRRLMDENAIPMVPVLINTYYPPNQPDPRRCLMFGRALRRAIETWEPARVAIVASGGLSHFVVDEVIDGQVLDAITGGRADALTRLPTQHLRSGTSEILNWVVVAGAAEHLDADVLDYVAAYRSRAGTGVGMAFARWG